MKHKEKAPYVFYWEQAVKRVEEENKKLKETVGDLYHELHHLKKRLDGCKCKEEPVLQCDCSECRS